MKTDWLVGTILFGALWCTRTLAQERTLDPRVDPGARSHIRQVIESLPRDCDLRGLLEGGQYGDGIHYPWMDDMKQEGVKEGWFRIKFIWDDGPKELTVARANFLSDYCGGEIEIKKSAQLEQIHSSGLERKLNEAALVRAKALLHDILHHAGWKRAHGTVFVVLTDDEWLPPLEGTESHEIIDSDRTPLM